MYQEITKKMDEYIALHKDEMLDVILNLAKYPSILEEGTEGAPFGKPCRECLDAAVEIMKQHGFTGGVSSDGSYGLMNYGSGDKTIGLFAHTDVVPVSPEDWIYTKPFEPKRMGDVLVGRGVEDNKAGVAASIYAIKLLEYAGLGLKNKVSVFLGSNEECGMADIEAFARENKMPDVSIAEYFESSRSDFAFTINLTKENADFKLGHADEAKQFIYDYDKAVVTNLRKKLSK